MPETSAATADCPPDTVFMELVEGRLDGPPAERLRQHIEGCAACRAIFEGLASGAALARGSADDLVARALAGGLAGSMVDRRYRLSRLLGEGGMGAVYQAEHTDTGRRVAIKLIHERLLARNDESRRRFRREARVVGGIQSPHIVQVLDAGEDETTGLLYLVMEHLRGEDLQRLFDRVGVLPADAALRIAAQTLAGLAAAHAAGVVHRDIKPANIFLAEGDDGQITVKLLDFGVAKVVAGEGAASTALTVGGTLLGSPLYMSPEQATGSPDVDHRTDLWSLGSVLYCALAGRAPFGHLKALGKVITAICSSPPPPLGEVAPWVRPNVEKVVRRALAVKPAQRYPSAAAMLAAIRPLLRSGTAIRREMLVGLPPAARAAPLPRATARARLAAIAAAAIAILVLLVRSGKPPAPVGSVSVIGDEPTVDAASTAVPEASAAPPPVTVLPPPVMQVTLRVTPADATVEVDGAPVQVRGGAVEIAGALGSSHRVRIARGRIERFTDVFVTEKGAIPPRVELALQRSTAPSETARSVRAASSASAAPPAPKALASDGGPRPIDEESRR
jgi:serine/threonine-protein kinase